MEKSVAETSTQKAVAFEAVITKKARLEYLLYLNPEVFDWLFSQRRI